MTGRGSLKGGILDNVPEILYAFDLDGSLCSWNRRLAVATGYTDDELSELDAIDFVPAAHEGTVLGAIDRVLAEESTEFVRSPLVTSAGENVPYEFSGAPVREDGEVIGLAGVGRDLSVCKRGDRPEYANRINAGLSAVGNAIVDATTRAEIEERVCTSLVTAAPYRGATIWGAESVDGDFEQRAAAGDVHHIVDALSVDSEDSGPAQAAIRTGEVIVAGATGDDRDDRADIHLDSTAAGERTAAPDEEAVSVAAVPIVTDDRVFGVLGLSTDRVWAYTQHERTRLRGLGRRVGDAIRAALTRQLLYADAVIEMELRITDPEAVFVDLSGRAGCRIELEHSIGFDEDLVMFATVTGASTARLLELAREDERIDHVERLTGTHDGQTFEFHMAGGDGTLASILTRYGARMVEAVAENGQGTVVAELLPEEDVRGVFDAVRERYAETELVAIREPVGPNETERDVRRQIDDVLTEKQRGALEAAFAAGYFEWPTRSSTAEDVAETLGIAPQTFHQHLRIAQQKLLDLVLQPGATDES